MSATARTLSGLDPLAENTYAEALKLTLIESTLALPAAGTEHLGHTFAAYSVIVLRLRPASSP